MATCRRCGASLSALDIAAHKKLVNRGADTFLCIPCLCAHFQVSESLLRDKLRQFQRQGCLLFSRMHIDP